MAEPAAPTMRAAPPDPDAPHVANSLTYIPGLDGVRAFAVLSVMVFHGGVAWSGGFLGVDTFFVLSGFLITTLLVAEWRRRDTIRLGAFWARRARRLLPALLLMLLFVAAYAAWIAPAGSYPDLRLDSLATLFYVANWHFILAGSSYWAQTGPVSPVTHTWSLAIEEQFYLVWPLVVLAVLHVTRSLRVLLGVCIGGAAASAILMAALYGAQGGADLTRLYYGTDTHAQCLLVGATLAVVLALVADGRRAAGRVPTAAALGPVAPGGDPAWAATGLARTTLVAAGAAGAVGTLFMWLRVDGQQGFVYRGGFLIAALLTALVVASVVCAQSGLVARALSLSPVRYVGRISYGLYLWHFPLFIFLTHARTGLQGWPLFVLRVAVTMAVATVSFFAVERPIRQGTFFRDWRAWLATPAAVALVVVALIGATVAPASALAGTSRGISSANPLPSNDPSLYQGPPVKVLMVGDSTALTLGLGLSAPPVARRYDVRIINEGVLGCGVAEGDLVRVLGVVYEVDKACQAGAPPSVQWPADWAGWIDQYHPAVVLFLAGRWEVADRTFEERWTSILNPAFQAYLKAQLQEAVDVATAKGAHMVMLTAPCYDSGEQPDGAPWPEDSPQRLAIYNRLVREVAAANPTRVTLVDLHHLVCPGGNFSTDIDGVTVRTDDGVHFTVAGGEFLAPAVLPEVVEAARRPVGSAVPTG